MPIIPTYTAETTSGTRGRVRATPTDMASGLDRAGAELQNIGEELEAFRDKNDLVNAQLDFEEGLVEINKQFDGDTGFGDIRERRAKAVEDLQARVTEGLSARAMEEATPLFRKFLMNDEVGFDSQATKSEGEFRVARFEEKKNTLMNSYIYAETDEEKELALNKIDTGLDSISPFIPVDKMAKYRDGMISDAKYLHASQRIPGLARSGKKFDPKTYKGLEPNQVIQLQSQYNTEVREIDAENRAYYNERIADHNAILMGTGKDDGLAAEMAVRGSRDLATELRANDKVNMIVYAAVSRGSAESTSGSIQDKYNAAREKLSYGVGDKMAAEKQKALNSLNSSAAREMSDFNADPAAFVAQTSPMMDDESLSAYADRTTRLQKVLAGNQYFPARVLSKSQASGYKSRMDSALTSGDSQTVVALIDELKSFGPRFDHQVLDELKVPGGMHVAMDADEGTASFIASLIAIPKAKDIDPEYNPIANVNTIMNVPFIDMINSRISTYDVNPALIEYRNDLVNLAHKWLASGKDVNELFEHYNVADSNRGSVVISRGVDEDVFDDKADEYLEGVDFSPYVSDGNPNKENIVEKLKSDAQLANAPSSDERIEPGQTAFYVINPMTGGLLHNYEDGKPFLITQDDILGEVRRTVQ